MSTMPGVSSRSRSAATELRSALSKLVSLLLCLFGISTASAQSEMPGAASLREISFDDYHSLPLVLRHKIGETLPSEAFQIEYVVSRGRKSLSIDTNGDGEVDARVGDTRPKVIPIGSDKPEPWLVWFEDEDWWIGPGRAWAILLDKHPVTVLDGNLDGRPDGDEDWIRFEKHGAFFRHHVLRLVPWEEHMAYYRFKERDNRTWLELRKDARTPGATDLQWQALLAFNRARMRAGHAPTRIEPARGRKMQQLAEEAVKVGYSFDRPFNTFESSIAKILQRPFLRPSADPIEAVAQLERTMVTRLFWMGTASKGFGYGSAKADGQDSGGVSAFLLGGADVRRFNEIQVYPAPGQVQVPREAIAEQPFVEEDTKFWEKKRGVPILVQFGIVDLRSIEFTVWRDRKRKKPVQGRTFTPDAPSNALLPDNLQSAFFVPEKPLDRHKRYYVECKFRLDYKSGRLLWSFETE
jgi:hypothetical protein